MFAGKVWVPESLVLFLCQMYIYIYINIYITYIYIYIIYIYIYFIHKLQGLENITENLFFVILDVKSLNTNISDCEGIEELKETL